MLDIQFIRENPELVEEKSKQKGYDVDIARLLELDGERRTRLTQIDELRRRRNELAAELKKSKPTEEQIAEGRELKDEISAREADLGHIESEYTKLLLSVPNTTMDDVPIGDEGQSEEVKVWGSQDTGAVDHLDFATRRDWVDFERGAKVAGAKFYFLKGDLALLENAITQFALDFILKKDFTFLTVPHLVSTRIARGAGFMPRSDKETNEYMVEGEDLVLIGTAEMPLTGYHADEIIDESSLPLCYVGYSPSYRKEAGTYGKHARGLFRVHQFNKLEMYIYSLPDK